MPATSSQLVVRRPRHEATPNEACRIWLEFLDPELPAIHEVELVDWSRHGAQLRLTSPLEPGETRELEVTLITKPDLDVKAKVVDAVTREPLAGVEVHVSARGGWRMGVAKYGLP